MNQNSIINITDTPITHAARERLELLITGLEGGESRRIVVAVTASMRTMERDLNVYRQREQEAIAPKNLLTQSR